jgi:hypothetical protein
MSVHQQHVLINSNGQNTAQNSTLQHYLVNNHIANGNDQIKNVHVQIVKQDPQTQRFVINRQYIPNQNVVIQSQQQPQQQHQQSSQQQQQQQQQNELPKPYWLIVEIESDNEINSYALVESRDVCGNLAFESLTTGKLVVVNIGGKQKRATVVMASG